MSAPPDPSFIAELTGPQVMGDLMNWGLMGALSVQVYLYHILFLEDPLLLRLFVYAVFVFEWLQTCLTTAESTFDKFVYRYGDIPNMLDLHITWFTVPIMCGIVSAAVQAFYARRIWLLSKSWILPVFICVLALLQLSASIAGGIYAKGVPANKISELVPKATVWIWLVGNMVVDIAIAVAMTILLLKSKSGLNHADTVINKIVRLGVESGMLTASVATITLALYAAFPDKAYYQCPAIVLAKLYANVMLTSLNNRAFLQRMRPPVSTMTLQSQATVDGEQHFNYLGRRDPAERTVRVQVLKETTYEDPEYGTKQPPKTRPI